MNQAVKDASHNNDPDRLNAVFFYGLYIEANRLRSMGVEPRLPETGSLTGYKVRLGRRGSLQRCEAGETWGVVYRLTHAEIDTLYPLAGLTDYVPEAVQVRLSTGETIAALCFITLHPAADNEINLSYVCKLADALMEWNLPFAQLSDQVKLIEPRRINYSSDQDYQEELSAYKRFLEAEFNSHF